RGAVAGAAGPRPAPAPGRGRAARRGAPARGGRLGGGRGGGVPGHPRPARRRARPRADVRVQPCRRRAVPVCALAHGLRRPGPPPHVVVGLGVDVAVVFLATHALPAAGPGIALMFVFNLAAGALFLSVPWSMAFAAAATAALLAQYAWQRVEGVDARPLAEVVMFAVAYVAVAALMHHLGRQMRAAQRLADRRHAEAANLAEINELVIRRMRIGVMLVDGGGRIRMANEAAQVLLREDNAAHDPPMHGKLLAEIAPELAARLDQWRRDGEQNELPMACGPERS